MIRKSIKRAWRETWGFLGGWTAFWAVLPLPVTGFLLHWSIQGVPQVLPELQIWAIYGLAAIGANVMVIFCWNLACAPYRIERDKRKALESRIGSTERAGSILDAFRGRESYTLGEVAKLLTTSSDHRGLVLDDLKRAVVSKKLTPIAEKDSWETLSIRVARSGLSGGPSGLSDEIRVAPDRLKEYLPKAGYGLPQWLEDKPT